MKQLSSLASIKAFVECPAFYSRIDAFKCISCENESGDGRFDFHLVNILPAASIST